MVNNSIPVRFNPILNESMVKRAKYYSVLKFFTKKYSPGADCQSQLIKIYSSVFNVKPDIKPSKDVSGLFQFRFYLLSDILFINAFDDEKKARDICDYYLTLFHRHFQNRIKEVFEFLYSDKTAGLDLTTDSYLELWKKNKLFYEKPLSTIVFTATMSSGKSMLVNALVGKEICKSQNLACTAKIHRIFSKPFEDGCIAEDDSLINLDASRDVLMVDDPNNKSKDLSVYTCFDICIECDSRLCFIDTPGVNSSEDKEHRNITESFFKSEQMDVIVYVINAENIGTNDDISYIKDLSEKHPDKKFIFVVNKLDKFKKEDNVSKTISGVKNDIKKIGIKNCDVCPVSAHAAFIAKQRDAEDDEFGEYQYLCALMSGERNNLAGFYSKEIKEKAALFVKKGKSRKEIQRRTLLVNSGLFGLENILIKEQKK